MATQQNGETDGREADERTAKNFDRCVIYFCFLLDRYLGTCFELFLCLLVFSQYS